MAANTNLHKAKTAKNDEFYTQLTDVAEELRHYKEHFKGKTVFCNCDDPTWSAFWKYFHLNFEELGLKKLISTHYDKNEPTYKMEYTGGNDNNIEVGIITPLEGNGDFRNAECVELLKEADIVVTNPPFSCYSEDTEVMTNNGWKFFKDVDINKDLIMSVQPVTKEIEWVKAVDYLVRPVNEYLYHYYGRGMDFLVTDNHKMYAYRKEENGEYRCYLNVAAQRLQDLPFYLPVAEFSWKGNIQEYFVFPTTTQPSRYSEEFDVPEKIIPMELWLEFFGMWLADGFCKHYTNKKDEDTYKVCICGPTKKQNEILDLIEDMGFEVHVYPGETYSTKKFCIYSKQLWEYLQQFGKSSEKFIPRDILDLDSSYLKMLWDSYMTARWVIPHKGRITFHHSSRRLMENLQEMALKIFGTVAQFKYVERCNQSEKYGYYTSSFTMERTQLHQKYPPAQKVPYNGNVYCLTLEKNHIMLVRRNGVVGWCGNCFREYVAQLVEYDKKFIIWGNNNAITYKEIFPLLKNNDMWLGYLANKTCVFQVGAGYRYDEKITAQINDGEKYGKVSAISVFTNLDIKKRHEKLILWKPFKQEDYPLYDNYAAFNVDKVADIPVDDCFELTVDEDTYLRLKETYGDDLEVLGIIEDAEHRNEDSGDRTVYNGIMQGLREAVEYTQKQHQNRE